MTLGAAADITTPAKRPMGFVFLATFAREPERPPAGDDGRRVVTQTVKAAGAILGGLAVELRFVSGPPR